MNTKQVLCKIHNQQVIFLNKGSSDQDELLCVICIQQRNQNFTFIEQALDQQNEFFSGVSNLYENNYRILQKLWDCAHQYKQQINLQLSKIIQTIGEFILLLEKDQENFQKLNQGIIAKNQQQVETRKLYNTFTNIVTSVTVQLDNLKEAQKLNNFYDSLNLISKSIQMRHQSQSQILTQVSNFLDKPVQQKNFEYKIMQVISNSTKQVCKCIALNFDGSMMIVGCGVYLIVYQLQFSSWKQLQIIKIHNSDINCVYYMNTSNSFVSGSSDKTISIFQINQEAQFVNTQVLQGHSASILNFIMNKSEDLLISGGCDKLIKFWYKNSSWSCGQTIENFNMITQFSLNESETKLICCGFDYNQILVIERNQNIWKIVQKIQVDRFGYRLCFISENSFIFQPEKGQSLQIYKFSEEKKTFLQDYEIKVSNDGNDNSFFPFQFSKKKGIILTKNCSCVNIFKINLDGLIKIKQTLDFGTHVVFGGISKDGIVMAIWDEQSLQIQIRRLNELF